MKLFPTCLLALLCCVVSTSMANDVVLSFPTVGALALSPDSRTVAVATAEGTTLVNTQWHSVITTFKSKVGATTVAWNLQGTVVATGSYNGMVQLWNVGKRQLLASYFAKGEPISAIAWSKDNTYLATGTTKGTIFLWNTRTNQLETTLQAHSQMVSSLAWNDNILVSAGKDNAVAQWSVEQSTPIEKYSFPYTTTVLMWSPDGTRLLVGTKNGAFIHDNISKDDSPLPLCTGSMIISAAWSTTGDYAAAVDATGAVTFWPESGMYNRPLYLSPSEPPALAFSSLSTVISSNRQEVILHDLSYTTPVPLMQAVLHPSLSLMPQPLAQTGTVQLSLPESTDVRLVLIDQHGRELALLHDGTVAQGIQSFPLNISHLSSGVYYIAAQSALYNLLAPCVIVR